MARTFDWRFEIIRNPALAKGLEDGPYFREVFKIMPPEQYFHRLTLFHIYQHYWLLNDLEVIKPRLFSGWSHNIGLMMQVDGNRRLWEKLKETQVFNPEFVQFVDTFLPAQTAPTTQAANAS